MLDLTADVLILIGTYLIALLVAFLFWLGMLE